jgi:histidine triad (HIT) family protein
MGSTCFLADGEAAFQEVFHTHLHVLPRVGGDGFTIEATAWSGPKPSRDALDANAEVIRAALSSGS